MTPCYAPLRKFIVRPSLTHGKAKTKSEQLFYGKGLQRLPPHFFPFIIPSTPCPRRCRITTSSCRELRWDKNRPDPRRNLCGRAFCSLRLLWGFLVFQR